MVKKKMIQVLISIVFFLNSVSWAQTTTATQQLSAPTFSCQQSSADYSACVKQYNQDMAAYNLAQNQIAQAQQQALTAEQQRLAQLQNSTASGSMAEASSKNKTGNMVYLAAGVVLGGIAISKLIKAKACFHSCPTGCCPAGPALMAAGAAFLLLKGLSNKQADEHATSAQQACVAQNQLSSTQSNCASGITYSSTQKPVTNWYDANGNCTSSAPSECVSLSKLSDTSSLGKLQTACGSVSCVTAGLGSFKQNGDGSITVKTPQGDKTYKLSDFADQKSMMAAGLSAGDAGQLFSDLYGANSPLKKAELDIAGALKNENEKSKGADFSSAGGFGGTNVVTIDEAKNSGKAFSETLPGAMPERRPTSEGLVKNYQGENIGVSGEDIFTMMARRYNLKKEQNTFIAP